MASNIIKYATANCSIWIKARRNCAGNSCTTPGFFGTAPVARLRTGAASLCACFEQSLLDPDVLSVFATVPAVFAFILRIRYPSYSRWRRRRNSRLITRKITPMHEPANIPLEVICHELEMKPFSKHGQKFAGFRVCLHSHASIVFQFQSIEILQLFPPIDIELWSMAAEVVAAAAELVADAIEDIDMVPWSIDIVEDGLAISIS